MSATGTREMLWVEYESSGRLDKVTIEAVVLGLSKLLEPTLVAAEDQRVGGFGIFVSDCDLGSVSSESTEEADVVEGHHIGSESEGLPLFTSLHTYPHDQQASTTRSVTLLAIETSSSDSQNPITTSHEESDREDESGSGGAPGNQKDVSEPGNAPGGASQNEGGDSNHPSDPRDHGEPGNGGGSDGRDSRDEDIQEKSATLSTTPRNTFVGQLNIKTREGYKQLLEIEFGPVISTETGPVKDVKSTMCMDRINVNATRMSVPPRESQSIMEQDGLAPYFVTESTTITVGVSGGSNVSSPYHYKPVAPDFLTGLTLSRQSQWGASFTGSSTPSASLTCTDSSGVSENMIPTSVGLRPKDLGAGVRGAKRWEYQVLESYKTNLECSTRHPPVHQAKFSYDITNNNAFPDYVYARVKNDFELSREKRRTFRNMLRSNIRHIRVSLEARIKRGTPEDYFQFPAPGKEGIVLPEFDIEFDGPEIGGGLPHTTLRHSRVGRDVMKLMT
jgi:hypothetical protein